MLITNKNLLTRKELIQVSQLLRRYHLKSVEIVVVLTMLLIGVTTNNALGQSSNSEATATPTLEPVAPGIGDPRPIEGNTHEIVQLTAEDGVTISAILMYPETGINKHSPAIVFHHGGFGGHPARQIAAPRFAAERLSAEGYTVLSLLSRQSFNHIRSKFEESQKDIKAAVDFVSSRGVKDVILASHSMGSIRIAGYMTDVEDPRVKAAIHFAPTADMPDLLRVMWGDEKYEEQVAFAQKAIADGRGTLDVSLDPDHVKGDTTDPIIDFTYTFQTPDAFLSWWGPNARTRNSDRFPDIGVPQLLLGGSADPYVPPGRIEHLKSIAKFPETVSLEYYEDGDHYFSNLQDKSSEAVIAWLKKEGFGPKPAIKTRLVDTPLATGRNFPGIMYSPISGSDLSKPVFLLQHGFTGTITQSSNNWLGERLAQAGYTALAPMTRSSGLTGIVSAKFGNMVEDLEDWVDFLEGQGYTNIVTMGHSLGGIWTALYAAQTQDDRIKGMIFLAPTRDLPDFAKTSLGEERYNEILAKAQKLVADGTPRQLITDKYYRMPPAPKGDRDMFIQQAGSWLDFWGPESSAVFTKRIAELNKPMLSIAGSKDMYVDWPYMEEIQSLTRGQMDLVWYDGDDAAVHSFRGHEDRVGEEVVKWAKKVFPEN